MHEVQNLALHIRNPMTRILKIEHVLQQRESPRANEIFPWARGVVGEWPFLVFHRGFRRPSPSTTTKFPKRRLQKTSIKN
jgi:hypothetical protein